MLGTPSRDRIAERREATRKEILAAAWRVARENGLAQLTLKDVATLVGMRAPSLYSHFDSKNAIYDAMFGEAWAGYVEAAREAMARRTPRTPRGLLKLMARTMFDYCVEDLARYQLMNQRTIPGFEPSAESYAHSLEAMAIGQEVLAAAGVRRQADVDLCTALLAGLMDQQLANDPGGDRWSRLLDRTIDMYADHVGV